MKSFFKAHIVLALLSFAACGPNKKQVEHVIQCNEVIVAKTPDTYQEVRHIVLRGTNEAIGKAFGDIAKEWLGVQPRLFKNALVGKANRSYLARNYPVLAERMKGLARSYRFSPDVYFESGLTYDFFPNACSVSYYPANSTENGHAIFAHNFDWRPGSFSQLFGTPGTSHDPKLCSKNFVIELYPTDGGYASIGIGGMDFVNGIFGGMNARGLCISVLVDQQCPKNMDAATLEDSCGLGSVALTHLILDTCATVDEAKTALLLNKMFFIFEGVHFLIADATGKSVICEIDPKIFQWHFTEKGHKPQVMTNHACYLYTDSSKFVKTQDPYDTFNRYKKIERFIKEHEGKFSVDQIKEAMHLIHGRGMRNEKKIRNRTFWHEIYDTHDKTLEVAFYLKDGALDHKTGEYDVVFTQPFFFKLKC